MPSPLRQPARWVLLWLTLIAFAGLLCAPNQRAAAQSSGRERLVYSFDFEEREKGNFEDLPMHWYPIGREKTGETPNFERLPLHQTRMKERGFPVYSEVRFDDQQHTSGKSSFYLGLNGGSAGAFLEVGTIPVVPNSDYLVTANVRTTVLEHARARLVAYFVDDKGNAIEGSTVSTDLIRTDNRWDAVSVRLKGDFSKAAWIGMEVQLLQPGVQTEAPLGKHQVVYQEVHGGAWFDDIGVWQLPRVVVGTQSSVNIIRAPDRPKLTMQVRDLTGNPLQADVTIFDYHMNKVAESHQSVGDGAPSQWRWTPTLPAFGWYIVDLAVRTPGSTTATPSVARTTGAFLWLDESPSLKVGDADRFVITSEDLSNEEFELLPSLFDRIRLEACAVSCWSRQTTLSNIEERQGRLDQFLQTMLVRGREVSLSLVPVPQDLVKSLDIDRDSPLDLFQRPQSSWLGYLAPVLLRDGQRVKRWQVGTTRRADAFFLNNLVKSVTKAHREFQSLAPQPEIVIPWSLTQSRRRDFPQGVTFAIDAPYSIKPDQLGAHIAEWTESPQVPFRLDLRIPPATELTHESRVNDLIERMLHSWEAGTPAIGFDRPWTTQNDHRTTILPDPLLGVFATTANFLAGRRVVGRMPLGEGLECFILDGPAGGMLAAWNRSAPNDRATIDMFLGPAPIAIDVFGNRTEVPLINGRHRWELKREPVFFSGIDPALALFRASFRLNEPFIDSTQTVHDRGVTITNPWPRTISGYMLVTQPSDWRIEPRRHFFSIAAGQSLTMPVAMSFPVSEVAGPKKLVARFDFNADQHYVVDLTAAMELGLKNISFDSELTVETTPKGGKDVIVTQLITNSSDRPMALYAFAHLPGYPRQERIIPRLKPGQSILRVGSPGTELEFAL